MALKKKSVAMEPTGQSGLYYIVGGRPNHQVYMPERVPEIQKLYAMEKMGTLKELFPKSSSPKALLGIDDRLLELAREAGHCALPNGDFITDDEEIAAKAWDGLKRINPDAYIHHMSMPIPEYKKPKLGVISTPKAPEAKK